MEAYSNYKPRVKAGFRLDPRTKIILMGVMAILVFLEHENMLYIAILALIPLVLLTINRQYKPVVIYGGLFAFALTVRVLQLYVELHFIFHTIGGMIMWLVLRLFPTLLLGFYMINSTKASEFVAAMHSLHITDKLTIPISVVFRFIPTIIAEAHDISYAMCMRDIRFGSKRFWGNPLALLEYKVVPMIISVVKIGEELSASAITKGLGKYKKRTCIAQLKFTAYDAMIYIACIGMIVWVVLI